jgi:hypothetical protein
MIEIFKAAQFASSSARFQPTTRTLFDGGVARRPVCVSHVSRFKGFFLLALEFFFLGKYPLGLR